MEYDIEKLRGLRRVPTRLVFDTADHPAASGIRSGELSSRHLLYDVGQLCLDLRFDHISPSSRRVLVGQLADREDPLKHLSGVPVLLVSEEKVLDRTTVNWQGEFQLEFQPQESMSLCLPCKNEELIEVPIA